MSTASMIFVALFVFGSLYLGKDVRRALRKPEPARQEDALWATGSWFLGGAILCVAFMTFEDWSVPDLVIAGFACLCVTALCWLYANLHKRRWESRHELAGARR